MTALTIAVRLPFWLWRGALRFSARLLAKALIALARALDPCAVVVGPCVTVAVGRAVCRAEPSGPRSGRRTVGQQPRSATPGAGATAHLEALLDDHEQAASGLQQVDALVCRKCRDV